MFSVFLLSYRNTRESLKKLWKHSPTTRAPTAFLISPRNMVHVFYFLRRLERVFRCTCECNLHTPLLRCTRQLNELKSEREEKKDRSCSTLKQMRTAKLSQIGFGYFSCNLRNDRKEKYLLFTKNTSGWKPVVSHAWELD